MAPHGVCATFPEEYSYVGAAWRLCNISLRVDYVDVIWRLCNVPTNFLSFLSFGKICCYRTEYRVPMATIVSFKRKQSPSHEQNFFAHNFHEA